MVTKPGITPVEPIAGRLVATVQWRQTRNGPQVEDDEMGWLSKLFGGGDGDENGDEKREAAEESAAVQTEVASERADIDPPDSPWATVLYPFPLEFDAAQLEEALEAGGLTAEQIEVGAEGVYRVALEETTFLLQQCDESYPDEKTDRRLLPETFPDDYAYLSIEPQVPDPLERRDWEGESGEDADVWGESGAMRRLTELVRAFLALDATAVVLNRSNHLVVPAQQFVDFTDGVEEGDRRAVMGWLDVEAGGEEEPLRTSGLGMFGFPELTIHYEHGSGWWRRQRRLEALRAVVGEMIVPEGDESFDIESTEEFAVTFGADFDKPEGGEDREGDVVSYRVGLEDRRLVMTPQHRGSLWASWAGVDDEGAPVRRPAYRSLLRYGCEPMLGDPVGSVPIEEIEAVEGISIDLYRPEEAAPVHFVTNGLGHRARPISDEGGGGEVERLRVELVIRAADPADELIDVLTNCAAGFELDDEKWGPAEILEFEEPLYNLQAFLLAPMIEVEFEQGPPVEIWQLVPLSDDERAHLSEEGEAEAWLEEHDGALGPEFAQRWAAVRG